MNDQNDTIENENEELNSKRINIFEYQDFIIKTYDDLNIELYQNREVETSICAYYYKDGIPISGKTIAVYEPETRNWKDVR